MKLTAYDGTEGRGPHCYRVRELREALADTYPSDAHLVTYVVEGLERQPRLKKRAWEKLGAPVSIEVFLADIDAPGHGEWEFPFYDHVKSCMEELPILRHAGLYFTMHGARIVQPIDRRISVGDVEPYIDAWVQELIASGLHREAVATVDIACRDWTRHFRLPHVRREVKRPDGSKKRIDYRSPNPDYDRMAPIEPPSPSPRVQVPKAIAPPRPARPAPTHYAANVPERWRDGACLLGDALSRIHDGRHQLHLALSAALAEKGVELEHVPAVVGAIVCRAGNDPKLEDRVRAARSTVERICAGEHVRGYGTLRMQWPEVAGVLEIAAEWAAAPPKAASTGTLAEAEAAMEEAIRSAPDGVTIIAAECGAGKSHAALLVAIERASKPQKGTRAPLGSKTVFSVPTHKLAIQLLEDVRAHGVKVRRHFSPASLLDHGEPVCQKHEVALPLVQGGQSQHYELCQGRGIEPCEFLHTCRAAPGWEGDEDARIVIAVHPLLSMLAREAGSTGLLVIDEPPPLPHSARITLEDLDATHRELASFDGVYAAALTPALNALWAWLRYYCPSPTPASLREALQAQRWGERDEDLAWARAGTHESSGDLVELARAAMSDDSTRKGPPLKWEAVQMARASPQAAARIGRASRVLNTLHFALTTRGVAKLYAQGEGGEPPAAIIAHVYEPLQRALAREGRTVILDANAAANLPLHTKALGYEPAMLTFAAPDGAPIERTLLRCAKATRTGWSVEADRFDVESGSFQNALEAVIEWALQDPHARSLAIITMKSIRQLLEDCLEPESPALLARYTGRIRLLKAARERLAPILRRWRGGLLWGHYGAVRGMNDMMEADLLVTIGDPRPNVTATQNDLALLELEDDAATRRVDALARAELEQAQGRLRACRRTRPARALHLGTLRPGGTGWAGEVEFRELVGGRPKNITPAMHLVKLRAIVDELGGVSHTARVIRISRTTLSNYMQGRSEPPAEVVERLKAAWAEQVRESCQLTQKP